MATELHTFGNTKKRAAADNKFKTELCEMKTMPFRERQRKMHVID